MIEITWVSVFYAALVTALATGLGALPFAFVKDIPNKWLGISNSLAAGLMLGASHGLITNGAEFNFARVIIGVLLGLVFISITHGYLDGKDEFQIGNIQGADAAKVLMIIGIMTLHSFSEGIAVGVSFGGGESLGGLITAAIALHNIPEGLAISLVIFPRDKSVWRAGLWSIFSSLPQPLMAVPAFLFVSAFSQILPIGLGFAAGAMIWMVFSELVPEALNDISKNQMAITVTLGMTAMMAFTFFMSAN